MQSFRGSRFHRNLRWGLPLFGAQIGTAALFTVQALASPALLTLGHAYCYYFSGAGRSGGMHLVAAKSHEIAAGPSNYVSGIGGKPQDSVFYVDCISGNGRAGGEAYVGMPRITMHLSGGHYTFNKQFDRRGIKHLGSASHATFTVSVTISGTVNQGVINGRVHLSAPGCLPHPIVVVYAGT